ncbi:hypothetical protein MFRU_011g02560 [Monilinia fructicola]|uniref:RNA polymerase II subunit B1 CTD phosphatase RPAP2 homolog n=1 Tax=Monilinia fructicola TaxID=38448 RepID=A0A5M9JPP9_MONFR|nr:hypothetical protein EYC84_000075 [Monilinia fructicola]KAG4030803.1 hypothetical protein MFRU_011g02560 [Monilinia fructicola]
MATPQKPKPILKKTTHRPPSSSPSTNTPTPTPPTTTTTRPSTPPPSRHLKVALYHAHLIQQRKAIEKEILHATELLIDYPLSTPRASPTDAQTFQALLRPFQPSDYDALILERNLDNRCGYTLCANPRPRDARAGQWRLLGMSGKAKDFRIARREETERWCSEACARRALYVRVQLSECPAWERSDASAAVRIDLLDGPKSEEDLVMDGIGNLTLSGGEESAAKERDSGKLALERGETGQGSSKNVTNFSIVEREVKQAEVKPPTFDSSDLSARMDTMHLDLEGHKSTFNHGVNYGDLFGEDDDDTEMDTDWKI